MCKLQCAAIGGTRSDENSLRGCSGNHSAEALDLGLPFSAEEGLYFQGVSFFDAPRPIEWTERVRFRSNAPYQIHFQSLSNRITYKSVAPPVWVGLMALMALNDASTTDFRSDSGAVVVQDGWIQTNQRR